VSWREKVQARDAFAFFSRSPAARHAFVREFLTEKAEAHDLVLYLCPKKSVAEARGAHPGAHVVSYEALTQRETWLRVNALVSPRLALVLERPSRYPKITSTKVQYIQKLAMQTRIRAVVDVVPFTLATEYVYTPYSYLGRALLGYPHYYAFRENYAELAPDGRRVRAHDPDVIARKVAPVSHIEYECFTRPRETVECPVTPEEAARYAALRAELFARERSPQRIVTALADLVHAFDSRLERLREYASGLDGPVLALTNLGTYAEQARRVAGVRAVSYQGFVGVPEGTAHVIYLESPIVKSYLLLDVEAALPPGVEVHHFRGDSKVDLYLAGRLDRELGQIDDLAIHLREACEQTVPAALGS
jgi:hypothetical protein